MKEYSEKSCYFVVKLSLIFVKGSTKSAVKPQALVDSASFCSQIQASFSQMTLLLCHKRSLLVTWRNYLLRDSHLLRVTSL